MKLATTAWPVGSLVLAGAALVATVARPRAQAPAPEPDVVIPVASIDLTVPDNARYFSIDLDGDGTPELVAETADRANAIVTHFPSEAPIAVIPLQFPGNPCRSELGIEEGRLTARDYGGPQCEETGFRRFRIRDGEWSTVTVTDTKIVIVDN